MQSCGFISSQHEALLISLPRYIGEYVTYVLYSEKFQRLYIGMTSDLLNRFASHNTYSEKGFTQSYRPWKVILVEFFNHKTEALKREKQLKGGQGRQWIKS